MIKVLRIRVISVLFMMVVFWIKIVGYVDVVDG